MSVDFDHLKLLWLMPLALLPLWQKNRESVSFSSLNWIPDDEFGRWIDLAGRLLALIAIAATVAAIAKPGFTGEKISRIGRGAEVLIMLDRSSSMDAVPRAIVTDGSGTTAGARTSGKSKNTVARELLTDFVTQRPKERFALMTFSTRSMMVAAFNDQNDAVLSGLAATAIGRGLPKTDLGGALLTSINQFRDRIYSGSRVILIVSDGGARLDETIQVRVANGLRDHRISLYFIYIRSTGSPADLHASAMATTNRTVSEEIALHQFFRTLETPYRLFQANDAQAMAKALTEIDQQQNDPLLIFERIPRQDLSLYFYLCAFIAGVLLLIGKSLILRPWT